MVVRPRVGHTLIELAVAIGIAGTLVVGLASATFITLKASDTSSSPATAVVQAETALSGMVADLQYALAISEKLSTAITVTVSDRNNDAVAETIRYAWSGVAGAPLTRRYNAGAAATVAEGVKEFSISYEPGTATPQYLYIRLRLAGSGTRIDTAIPLMNRP